LITYQTLLELTRNSSKSELFKSFNYNFIIEIEKNPPTLGGFFFYEL